VQWSPCCRRRARVADRGGGGGDLAARRAAGRRPRRPGANAELEVVAARAELVLLDVGRELAPVAVLLPASMPGSW
jgi:hypothetical protein